MSYPFPPSPGAEGEADLDPRFGRTNTNWNQAYGAASDAWALGVCLYEIAALRRPFEADPAPKSRAPRGQPSAARPADAAMPPCGAFRSSPQHRPANNSSTPYASLPFAQARLYPHVSNAWAPCNTPDSRSKHLDNSGVRPTPILCFER